MKAIPLVLGIAIFCSILFFLDKIGIKEAPSAGQLHFDRIIFIKSNHGGCWVSKDGTNYQYFKDATEAFK